MVSAPRRLVPSWSRRRRTERLGTHSLKGTEIDFAFEDSNTAGEWRASGTIDGDCLTVEYNPVMFFAGFEDGEYCRPSTS